VWGVAGVWGALPTFPWAPGNRGGAESLPVRPLVREGFPLVIDAEQPADDYDDTHTESLIHCWRQEIWALALSRPLPRPCATTALQHAEDGPSEH